MTQYQGTLDPQALQRLFTGDKQLGQFLETILNQIVEAQVAEQLQAAPYERTEERQGYRNGYKSRRLRRGWGGSCCGSPRCAKASSRPSCSRAIRAANKP